MQRRKLLTLLCGACVPAREAIAQVDEGPLVTLAQSVSRRHGVCSLSFAVVSRGASRAGHTVSGCNAGTMPEVIYQAASLAKPVFASIVLRLAGENVIDLDAPIGRYFPNGYAHRQNLFALNRPPVEDTVTESALRAITPRRLLAHTAGLPNWAGNKPLQPDPATPGGWNYSGEGYVLLQRAVEHATGESLSSLAQRLVFDRLKMQNSAFSTPEQASLSVAPGFSASGQAKQLRFPPSLALASVSLHTTANDFATFLADLLSDEMMLMRIVERPVAVRPGSNLQWGLGWGIEHSSEATVLWHWGSNPGYRSLAVASMTDRNAIVVLTNSDAGMSAAKELVSAAISGANECLDFPMVR
jgi:CubicO group peptidase (beta-lactamase class C family)